MKIEDTYKAAYLMTQGARIVDVEIKHNVNKKMMFSKRWVVVLDEIPLTALSAWDKGEALVNVEDFKRERTRIKKLVKKIQL